ncbi:MAG: hypothetical protein NXI10_14620 [bacterium]|nr:hypothetical protein [bacterium]
MSESKYIEKHLDLPKGMDYEFLKEEGLRKIQQLAGDNWTDFNVHDPGVTILEQLAYALSELGYRTELDFKDLYASQQRKTGNNTFYTAAKILPTNPVTTVDIRKQLLDEIPGIQNVWIYPLNSFTRRKNIQGLYLVFVEMSSYTSQTPEQVKEMIRQRLNHSHNIGETFEDVIILKQKEIFVEMNIELEKDAYPEKVHAQVIFQLKQLISNPIRYYSLNEMMDMGFSVDQVFDGPPLRNGFILDADMKEKSSIFFNSQLVNHLREIEGIKTIRSLNLLEEHISPSGAIEYRNYFDDLSNKERGEIAMIPWDSIGVLSKKMQRDANNSRFFRYTSDGIQINLYQKEVDRILKELDASVRKKNSQNLNQKNDFDRPLGKQLKVNNYKSIQNEFPTIYGLRENAISENTPAQRQAEIYQLKGFLLFFEQIISNYLAQLSRFNELYTLDKDISASYFTQVPWDIPRVYELIRKTEETTTVEEHKKLVERSVQKLMSNIDRFYERRSRFLAHLLVRFGDDSHLLNFSRFNYYHSREEHQRNQINQQIDILKNYPELSKDKARSFNHTLPFWKEDREPIHQQRKEQDLLELPINLSVLEQRIRIMLGLPLEPSKIGEFLLPKVHFKGKSHKITLSELLKSEMKTKFVDMIGEPMGLWTHENELSSSKNESLFKNIKIDEDIFRRGMYLENLKVIKVGDNAFQLLFRRKQKSVPDKIREFMDALYDPETKEKTKREAKFKYILDDNALTNSLLSVFYTLNNGSGEDTKYFILRSEDGKEYCLQADRNERNIFPITPTSVFEAIATFETEDEAFECGFSLRNTVRDWNFQCESLYVVDHILLRPQFEELKVNILLNDPNSNWSFRLLRGFPMKDIENGIRGAIKLLRSGRPEFAKKNDLYFVHWKNGIETIGRSTEKYADLVEAERAAEEMLHFFKEFSDLDIHDPNRIKFKREYEEEEKMDHPMFNYSFTITVVLPNWTARFNDSEFQYYLESMIRKHTAAHVGVHFKWVDLHTFAQFEVMYDLWLKENAKEELNFTMLNEVSNELMTFIKNAKSVNL